MKTTKTEVTTDIVVERSTDRGREILLIKRGKDPYEGKWALPGGFVETDEEVATAAVRELKEETSIELKEREELEFIDYFDAPDRDPRGRLITFAFGIKLDQDTEAKGGDDAAEARWFPLDELPELAFDHRTILARWKEK